MCQARKQIYIYNLVHKYQKRGKMDINIHIEKKHFYTILALIILGFSIMFVFAGHGDRIPPEWTVGGMYTFLQDVVSNDAKDSVDFNNNGVIDDAENLNASDTGVSNLTTAAGKDARLAIISDHTKYSAIDFYSST